VTRLLLASLGLVVAGAAVYLLVAVRAPGPPPVEPPPPAASTPPPPTAPALPALPTSGARVAPPLPATPAPPSAIAPPAPAPPAAVAEPPPQDVDTSSWTRAEWRRHYAKELAEKQIELAHYRDVLAKKERGEPVDADELNRAGWKIPDLEQRIERDRASLRGGDQRPE